MKNIDECVSRLTEAGIRRHLPDSLSGFEITVYDVTDSTNLRAKEAAEEDDPRDSAFIADSQTAGRGRLDRRFFSPAGVGLYLSILRTKHSDAQTGLRVTAISAVAVCRAIESLTGAKPKIKWVNDVYLGEKKLCGILTQGALDEQGDMKYTISGIGINLYHFDMPREISDVATTLEDETGLRVSREELCARIISEYCALSDWDFSAVCEQYENRSLLIGRTVKVYGAGEPYTARVLGIDGECALLVEKDGKTVVLSSGEVSIRDF